MSVIIRLQNLPMSANASNIRRFFSGLAIPEGGVHIVGGNDGDAFIAFATDEDARKAMLLDRQAINGAAVRLLLSSKTEMQTIIETARSTALFPPAHTPAPQTMPVQKTETMQALDVTTPTLPTSFPSYRNGEARDSYSSDRGEQLNYAAIRSSPLSHSHNPPPFENLPSESRQSMRPPSLSHAGDSQRRDNTYDTAASVQQFQRYDDARVHPVGVTRDSTSQYTSYYNDGATFDRRRDDHAQVGQEEKPRGDPRVPYPDTRFERIPHAPMNYDQSRPLAPFPERFISPEAIRERRDLVPEPNVPQCRGDAYSNLYECNSMPPPLRPPNERDFLKPPAERDFSVRPPWLNDNNPPGLKRLGPPPVEQDEYPRKRPFPPAGRLANENSETEFVVRVTVPVSEVGIKAIFDILRGVHIVPKWGIRIEEDVLQRPTGYIFIMMTARDSFDRALTYNGRPYKNFPVKVLPSSTEEFYRVTDSSFRNKCPSEIIKKLPQADQPVSPPHHSDGCLEVTEFPRDATKLEIVRFLGAPGLTVESVVIAGFAASDKTAQQGSDSIRALVTLPSAKDIRILLSAKPRPLRPDGTCPPVRLTPISQMQLEAYSVFRVEDKPSAPVVSESTPIVRGTAESASKISADPLSCAYLSGLSKPMRDSDVIRLFSTVLIPGDAIKMVNPENTSAYIDFISENNCRRAITDITANNSKATIEHPRLSIDAISRSDMEVRCPMTKDDSTHSVERSARAPARDPRENRNQWDTWSRVAHPQLVKFPSRSPPNRPKFDDYQDRNIPQQHFQEVPYESFPGHTQRPLPPVDFPYPGPPPMHNDGIPSRSGELPPMGGPPRRPPMLNAATVFISNLPPSVTPEQLANVMRDYYFIPGSIRLRRDLQGIPTGDALVDFRSAYYADRTVRELTGYRIAGRSIVMRHDRPADL